QPLLLDRPGIPFLLHLLGDGPLAARRLRVLNGCHCFLVTTWYGLHLLGWVCGLGCAPSKKPLAHEGQPRQRASRSARLAKQQHGATHGDRISHRGAAAPSTASGWRARSPGESLSWTGRP